MKELCPLWKGFGVHGVPALVLIDRNEQIIRHWTGKVNHKEVEKTIAELVESEPLRKSP